MSQRLDWMISVDDHVVEPGHVWQERVPKHLRDLAPRLVTDDQGEAWVFENRRTPTTGLMAAAGISKEEFSPAPIGFQEMRPGCYDPLARVEDMNRDGVLASLCFPTFPRFCGQTFSKTANHELGMACIEAYNDWMIEDWCGAAPGRLIPMIILPMWEPQLAAREIERTAAKGAKAITFSENPSPLGFPSIHDRNGYWDPVFAAASETGMPLCTHIGSSSKLPRTSPDAPIIITVAVTSLNAMMTCCDWLFSGIFGQFPELKVCLSEGGIGWIPATLEKCDYTYNQHRYWGEADYTRGFGGEDGDGHAVRELNALPSELFRSNMYGCFIDDMHGVDSLDAIGIDNVMIETDYPHTDSTWPNSMKTAQERLRHRSDEDVYKIFQGNARRVFNFTPAEAPVLA